MFLYFLTLAIEQVPPQDLDQISLLSLLTKGGYMMIPLVILWIVGVYIFIERVITFRKSAKTPTDFQEQIRRKVLDGRVDEAKLLCDQTTTPVARMIRKGIDKLGSSMKNIEVAIEID
jgi:biopolymer transport protein ExbB